MALLSASEIGRLTISAKEHQLPILERVGHIHCRDFGLINGFLGKGQERKIQQAQYIQVNKADLTVPLQGRQAEPQPMPMSAFLTPRGSAATCRSQGVGSSSCGDDGAKTPEPRFRFCPGKLDTITSKLTTVDWKSGVF